MINFVFPITCSICGNYLSETDNTRLCNQCINGINYIKPLYCQLCGIPLPYGGAHCYNCLHLEKRIYYEYIRGVCVYDGVIKKCIQLFKYHNKDYLSEFLGSLLVNYIKSDEELSYIDIIVPVPLHCYKKIFRGYNQSELLAKIVAKKINKTLVVNNLYRKKNTQPQVKLNRNLRIKNVENAFAIKNSSVFENKIILVIDDVCTTGETINQCAKVLIKSKARKVYGLTVARDI